MFGDYLPSSASIFAAGTSWRADPKLTLLPSLPVFIPCPHVNACHSELFLEKFAARAFNHAEKRGRRLIKYQDVSDVRVQDTNLLFLEAVVPP